MTTHIEFIKSVSTKSLEVLKSILRPEQGLQPIILSIEEENALINGHEKIIRRVYVKAEDSGDSMFTGWVLNQDASHCLVCSQKFGVFAFKHHCKACGLVVCHECGKDRAKVSSLISLGDVRVCKQCYYGQDIVDAMNTMQNSVSPRKLQIAKHRNNGHSGSPSRRLFVNTGNGNDSDSDEYDYFNTTSGHSMSPSTNGHNHNHNHNHSNNNSNNHAFNAGSTPSRIRHSNSHGRELENESDGDELRQSFDRSPRSDGIIPESDEISMQRSFRIPRNKKRSKHSIADTNDSTKAYRNRLKSESDDTSIWRYVYSALLIVILAAYVFAVINLAHDSNGGLMQNLRAIHANAMQIISNHIDVKVFDAKFLVISTRIQQFLGFN